MFEPGDVIQWPGPEACHYEVIGYKPNGDLTVKYLQNVPHNPWPWEGTWSANDSLHELMLVTNVKPKQPRRCLNPA